jgi:homopolymeric O-antigen transport system permease protein
VAEFQAQIAHAANLVFALTARELRMRYQGTVLGYLWWMGRPLALGLVLYFAMRRVVEIDVENYGIFLMSALFPWFWFQSSVMESAGSVVGNGGLIKKVVFPRMVLPLTSVAYNSVQFALTVPVLMIFVIVSGEEPRLSWIWGIPLLFAVQFALLVGIGQFVSAVQVLFRDLGPILDVSLTLAFYVSPIIFPLDRVPGRFHTLFSLNPLAPLLEAWRELMISGGLPDASLWPTLAFAAVMLVGGWAAFRSLEKYFADAI